MTFFENLDIIHEERLTPKALINKYQLDKSHIAFTLCTKLSDDSYELYPETTIISSVITEIPTSKKPNGKLLYFVLYN